MFRANLDTYSGSGYDRGHLVASANQREVELQNSETFLLSNMSPQAPKFNRGVWKRLEGKIRELSDGSKVFETYVICGSIFDFTKVVSSIGDEGGFTVPIPNSYFKSVLAETKTGALNMWSFIIPNKETDKALDDFRVPTTYIEKYVGVELWSMLDGTKIKKEKEKIRSLW